MATIADLIELSSAARALTKTISGKTMNASRRDVELAIGDLSEGATCTLDDAALDRIAIECGRLLDALRVVEATPFHLSAARK